VISEFLQRTYTDDSGLIVLSDEVPLSSMQFAVGEVQQAFLDLDASTEQW
jgi:hypothetical protein